MHRIAIHVSLAAVALLGASLAAGCGSHAMGQPATPPAAPADKDQDGIADSSDSCPDVAGKPNTDKTKNGCPEQQPITYKWVTKNSNELSITEQIQFEKGLATIKSESDDLLSELATFIKQEGRDINLIEVAGHTDADGSDKVNLKLSDDRANAVREALLQRGVDSAKLRAKGYGPYCPLDPKKSADAYAKNRRVQFLILKMNGTATGVVLGCEGATKKGVKADAVP